MRTRALIITGCIALCVWGATGSVLAQHGEETFPSCELDAEAVSCFHARYGAGHVAMNREQWAKAQAAFEDALEICAEDEVYWFLSVTAHESGDKEAAARYRANWKSAQRDGTGAADEGNVGVASLDLEQVQESAQTQRAEVESLPLDPPEERTSLRPEPVTLELSPLPTRATHLSVTTSPSGAMVVLGPTLVGVSPVDKFPIPAYETLMLRVEKDGYHPWTRELYVSPEVHQRLHITLRPLKAKE